MSGEKPSSDARRARLERALKANLSRRKEQARSRKAPAGPQEAPEASDGEDGCPN